MAAALDDVYVNKRLNAYFHSLHLLREQWRLQPNAQRKTQLSLSQLPFPVELS